MALFPQRFIDDLKHHADIVVVIQDYVSLKKTGATYKGLCPFHGEKTPSFHVNREKGFFHCFGCGVGGDVLKFLELHEKIGFHDAVKQLAARFGMGLPELEQNDEQRAGAAEREALLKVHEVAAEYFRQQLAEPGGARIRKQIADRDVTQATSDALGLGYAPRTPDGLKAALLAAGFSPGLLIRAGLVVQREDGSIVDRFRNRLMIPICRDTGSVIGFGGRSVDTDQQPKYLNSPETPIYSKGRTLYGLNLGKAAMRQGGFGVLVEGYFDFAQLYQAGFQAVVASCGTALTPYQAQQLRRFTGKVVLSFDPDAAGQGAATKSCEMLVAEGFEVNVAVLPAGDDPDTFIRTRGRDAYAERLRRSQPYLDYLLDRMAERHNLNSADGKVRFVDDALQVLNRISDRTRQELFVQDVAGRAGISEAALWPRVNKATTPRQAGPSSSQLPALGQVTKAEKALIWWLVHRPEETRAALGQLEAADVVGLATGSVLDLARQLNDDKGLSLSMLLERLNTVEAQLVTGIASEAESPVHEVEGCVFDIKRLRCEREYAALQRDLDRAQREGNEERMNELLGEKSTLLQRIAVLKFSKA